MRIVCVIAIAISVFYAQAAQTAARAQDQARSVREELLRVENEWNAAYNRHDQEGVSRILADDYALIDADGYVLNKRQYLDTIPRVEIKSENLKYPNVRVYGDAAIVNSIWNGTYSFDGKNVTETIQYTDVFIRKDGKWQAVASQGTRIPKR